MGTITVKLGTGEEHVLPWDEDTTVAVNNRDRHGHPYFGRYEWADVVSVKIDVKADATEDGAEVAGGEGEAQPEPQKKPKSARRPKGKP